MTTANIVLLVVMFAVYAAIIIPMRRRQTAARNTLASLQEGDLIVTSSGIYGEITEIDGDVLFVEVAPKIELKMNRSAVSERVVDPESV